MDINKKKISLNQRESDKRRLINNDLRSFRDFEEGIRNVRTPSDTEVKRLFHLIRKGGADNATPEDRAAAEKAKARLTKGNQKFILALAKRYTNDTVVLMDLVSQGNIGLLSAISSYDESRGFKFLTHAVWHIRKEMVNFMSDGQLIRRPSDASNGNRIKDIKEEFLKTEQRMPTDDEVAQLFSEAFGNDISKADTETLSFVSIDGSYTTNDGNEMSFADCDEFTGKTCSHNDYKDVIKDEADKAIAKALIEKLDEREQGIIKMAFGIDADYAMEYEDIATIYGISKERVRQLVVSSLEKMRKAATLKRITP